MKMHSLWCLRLVGLSKSIKVGSLIPKNKLPGWGMRDGYSEQDRLFLCYPNQYVAFEFPVTFISWGFLFSVPVKTTTQVPMQEPSYSSEFISSIAVQSLWDNGR
uniref:Uncharacterized protein n=1 Tax=Micrurus carvalhoi TaxID=3147026 RepID=A0A2H6NEP8_9SAUR